MRQRWEPRTRLGRRIAEDEKRATEAHPDDPGHWDLPAWAFLVVVAACVGYAVMTVLITDSLGFSSRVGEAFAWTGRARDPRSRRSSLRSTIWHPTEVAKGEYLPISGALVNLVLPLRMPGTSRPRQRRTG